MAENRGRPAKRMKQLAALYLENPGVLSDLKELSRLLKVSYKNAFIIRRRFISRSNGMPLCPTCLEKMVEVDMELVCPRCGRVHRLPKIPLIKHSSNTGVLGTVSTAPKEGVQKFVQECERELLQVLKGFTLSPTELEEAKRVLRGYAESYYCGRSNALDRFRVCLITLATVSDSIPQLKQTPSFYLLAGPLLKRKT